jgi:hypothetical protein
VTRPDDAVPDIPIGFPRGEPSTTGRAAAAWTAAQLLGELGLPGTDVQVAAQWVGTLPGSEPDEVAVVTVTLPSGAVAVAAQLNGPDRAGRPPRGGICGRAVLPAGPPASQRLYALTCDVFDLETGAPRDTSLVIVAPRNVSLVRLYDADRTFLFEQPATDGVAVLPLPPDTDTVEALIAGGVTLGRVGLLGYTDSLGD